MDIILTIKLRNPCMNEETDKKVSAMNYSFRFIIGKNTHNYIFKCRQLLNQYVVDMYAKIETKRLFLQYYQKFRNG